MAYAGAYCRVGGAAAALSLGLWPVSGITQEADFSGLLIDMTYSELLVSEDDFTTLRSDLGVTLRSRTANQDFIFSFGAGLDKFLEDDELNADLIDPRASLFYALDNRNTLLELDASFRRDDIDTFTEFDILGETALVLAEGEREDTRYGLTYEFGREAPFGGVLSYNFDAIRYEDSIATNLLDSDSERLGLVLRFDINDAVSARASLRHSELDRDGGLDVERQSYALGATIDINEAATLDVDLGFTEVTQSGTAPTSTTDGLFFALGYRLERPNGEWRASLRSDIDENGRRTTARVDRQMALPQGELSFGFGVSHDDDNDDLEPLYTVRYAHDLPRGGFNVSFQQAFSTTTTGEETLDSRLTLGFQQELTSLSNFSAGLTFREANVLDNATADTQQLNLNLDYSYELTNDWAAIAGYSYVRREENGGNSSTDNEFFVGVRTSLQWRP